MTFRKRRLQHVSRHLKSKYTSFNRNDTHAGRPIFAERTAFPWKKEEKVKAILFDVDDTLYDQVELFGKACRELFGNRFSIDIRRLFEARTRRSDEVFELSQTGRISMEEMYIYRIQKAFEDFGEYVTEQEALRFQEIYEKKQRQLCVTDTMKGVLDYCVSRKVPLGVITNGPSAHQWKKIDALGLTEWMPREHIIVSGDCQVMKPSREIFDHARTKLGLTDRDECWFVGDSYSNDVIGAKNAGWKAVWLKKRDHGLSEVSCHPDYQTESEEELKQFIETLV